MHLLYYKLKYASIIYYIICIVKHLLLFLNLEQTTYNWNSGKLLALAWLSSITINGLLFQDITFTNVVLDEENGWQFILWFPNIRYEFALTRQLRCPWVDCLQSKLSFRMASLPFQGDVMARINLKSCAIKRDLLPLPNIIRFTDGSYFGQFLSILPLLTMSNNIEQVEKM